MPINAFRERTEHNLDAKGRLNIPARFLNCLATKESNDLIIVPWFDHLRGFPVDVWAKREEKLLNEGARAASEGNKHFGTWVRMTLGTLSHVIPDKQGRVLIAPALRQIVKLEKEIVLTGMGDWFEIWDKSLIVETEKEAMENPEAHQNTLLSLGLF